MRHIIFTTVFHLFFITASLFAQEVSPSIYTKGGGFEADQGREFERNIVGSSQPLLKTLWGYGTGRDAYFGSKYGSYDKAPEWMQMLGADERGEAGRIYQQIKNTGLIQPIESITNQFENTMILENKRDIIILFEAIWKYIALFNFKHNLLNYYPY